VVFTPNVSSRQNEVEYMILDLAQAQANKKGNKKEIEGL
jgi:hypothetical protein